MSDDHSRFTRYSPSWWKNYGGGEYNWLSRKLGEGIGRVVDYYEPNKVRETKRREREHDEAGHNRSALRLKTKIGVGLSSEFRKGFADREVQDRKRKQYADSHPITKYFKKSKPSLLANKQSTPAEADYQNESKNMPKRSRSAKSSSRKRSTKSRAKRSVKRGSIKRRKSTSKSSRTRSRSRSSKKISVNSLTPSKLEDLLAVTNRIQSTISEFATVLPSNSHPVVCRYYDGTGWTRHGVTSDNSITTRSTEMFMRCFMLSFPTPPMLNMLQQLKFASCKISYELVNQNIHAMNVRVYWCRVIRSIDTDGGGLIQQVLATFQEEGLTVSSDEQYNPNYRMDSNRSWRRYYKTDKAKVFRIHPGKSIRVSCSDSRLGVMSARDLVKINQFVPGTSTFSGIPVDSQNLIGGKFCIFQIWGIPGIDPTLVGPAPMACTHPAFNLMTERTVTFKNPRQTTTPLTEDKHTTFTNTEAVVYQDTITLQ